MLRPLVPTAHASADPTASTSRNEMPSEWRAGGTARSSGRRTSTRHPRPDAPAAGDAEADGEALSASTAQNANASARMPRLWPKSAVLDRIPASSWIQGEGGGAAVRVNELWPTPSGLRVDRGLQLPAVAGPQLCQGPVAVRGAGHEAGTHRFTM